MGTQTGPARWSHRAWKEALGIDVPLLYGGSCKSENAGDLLARIKGDCHSHSNWSDGGSPIDEMVLTAVELGHEWLVLTDHSPQLRVANGLTAERLTKQLAIVEAVNASLDGQFRLLKGIEVDILDDGALDQTDTMLGKLDLVIGCGDLDAPWLSFLSDAFGAPLVYVRNQEFPR